MARNVSAVAREAVNASQTNQVFLTLLEIDHADLASPMYFVNNTQNILSNGNTYQAVAFRATPPSEEDGVVKNTNISIDNIDRAVVQAIRSIGGSPPTVKMSIILASDPDTVEAGPWEFLLTNVSYNLYTVSGDLVYLNYLKDYMSLEKYSPNSFPGLYA